MLRTERSDDTALHFCGSAHFPRRERGRNPAQEPVGWWGIGSGVRGPEHRRERCSPSLSARVLVLFAVCPAASGKKGLSFQLASTSPTPGGHKPTGLQQGSTVRLGAAVTEG